MNKLDYIYYDYRFLGIKPKKIHLRLYCKFRKFITIKESPSKVMAWDLEDEVRSIAVKVAEPFLERSDK